MQTLGLLPSEMDPAAVARFLRSCPGLNKQTTGELLGEYDEFFLEVLRHFTDTFDFTGISEVLCVIDLVLYLSVLQLRTGQPLEVISRVTKQTTAELLGMCDQYLLEALRHFTDTFNFTGLALKCKSFMPLGSRYCTAMIKFPQQCCAASWTLLTSQVYQVLNVSD